MIIPKKSKRAASIQKTEQFNFETSEVSEIHFNRFNLLVLRKGIHECMTIYYLQTM